MEGRQVRTGIDRFLELVNSDGSRRISALSKTLGVPEATLELWSDILRQDGLIDIDYDSFGKMIIQPARKEGAQSEEPAKSEKPAKSATKHAAFIVDQSAPTNVPAYSSTPVKQEERAIKRPVTEKHSTAAQALNQRFSRQTNTRGKILLKKLSKMHNNQAPGKEEGAISKLLNFFKHSFPGNKSSELNSLPAKPVPVQKRTFLGLRNKRAAPERKHLVSRIIPERQPLLPKVAPGRKPEPKHEIKSEAKGKDKSADAGNDKNKELDDVLKKLREMREKGK